MSVAAKVLSRRAYFCRDKRSILSRQIRVSINCEGGGGVCEGGGEVCEGGGGLCEGGGRCVKEEGECVREEGECV